jgi:hypothetical protein
MADYSRFMKRHAQRLREEAQRQFDETRRNEKFRDAMRLMHPAGHIDTSKIAPSLVRVETPEPPPAMLRTLH